MVVDDDDSTVVRFDKDSLVPGSIFFLTSEREDVRRVLAGARDFKDTESTISHVDLRDDVVDLTSLTFEDALADAFGD